MMKFASFEIIVELLYKYAIPTPKDQYSKSFQLGVSFAGGYVASVFCVVVSHPADNLVSFLNNSQRATVGDAVKKLGLSGMFTRGLSFRIVMIETLIGVQWGIYDAFKVFVGLKYRGFPWFVNGPSDCTMNCHHSLVLQIILSWFALHPLIQEIRLAIQKFATCWDWALQINEGLKRV